MTEVKLKYKEEAMKLNFPSSWNELSRDQLLYIASNWHKWKEIVIGGGDLVTVKSLLLLQLSGLKKRKELKKLCGILSRIDERTDSNILEVTDFIFQKNTLTKNLIPTIRTGPFTHFYGPGDRLGDVSIDEFSFAFRCYLDYCRTNTESALNRLVAVLYRPGNGDYSKTGEKKKIFDNKLIPIHELKVAAVKADIKQAIYLFFDGCLEHLAKRYPAIFKRAKSDGKGGGSFVDTIVAMSGGKFGPFEQTKRTDLHLVLRELDRMIRESEDLKQKRK